MFNSISWLEYLQTIVIVLAIYYIVIAILFNKKNFLKLFFKKQQQQKSFANETGDKIEAFFLNQIEDDENREFENSFNHQKDSEEKDSRNKQINEAEFSATPVHVTQPELFTSHQKYTPRIPETDDMSRQVQELTARLKEAISQAVNKNYIKEEFILSLKFLLKKYYFLKESPFLVPINNMIESECEKYGYIQLSAEERVMLWNE
jgi:FtsZ-interacting cell division protein ZipA